MIVVIPLLVVALTLFMNRTKYGLAIRASAANADAARLAGINIKKMSTIVWVISGALAATAAMLFAPLNPAGASALGVGPGMLLRVLAAALIGGMASLPLALAGGVAIGIGESLINYNYNDQRGLLDLVLFVVVLVTLLVSGRRRGLAEADSGRWSFAPRIRPIPAALQSKWWVRSLPAFGVGLVALLALFPLVFLDLPSQREAWSRVLLYALVALSLTVLTGWAGQLSLGQFAFVGVGGLTTAALVRNGVGFIPALVLAACVTALVAIIVGAPALRRPGLYLAVTTFAFAVMTSSWLLWRNVFLDGRIQAELPRQVLPLPAALFDEGWSLRAQGSYYVICLIALGVVLLAVALLQRSRLGRSMIAVRDNERAAASLGISPGAVKITAFGIGGWIAGLAGGLFVGLVTRGAGRLPRRRVAPRHLDRGHRRPVVGRGRGAGRTLGRRAAEAVRRQRRDRAADERRGVADPAALLPGRSRAGVLQRPRRVVRVARAPRAEVAEPVAARQPLPTHTRVAPREIRPDLDAVIRVVGLSVSFGPRLVLEDVDLHVGPGEVVGLIGANGAGKSTLMNAIGGFVRSTGSVEILGHERTGSPRPSGRASGWAGRSKAPSCSRT